MEKLRWRMEDVQAVWGCSKAYVRAAVKRGLLTPHRESRRFVWYERAEVMRLCGINAAAAAGEQNSVAPAPEGKSTPQIVDAPTQKRGRGRPRKPRLEA